MKYVQKKRKRRKTKKKMIQNFTYILLCGIIILLAKFSGSECCA